MTSAAYRSNYGEIDWKPLHNPRPPRTAPKRSSLVAPSVIGDTMDPIVGQHNGKIYTSKSALRASYKRHNMVELGNDPARFRTRQKPKVDRKAIKDSLDKAAARFNRGERASKA